jgi:hypothetical protein
MENTGILQDNGVSIKAANEKYRAKAPKSLKTREKVLFLLI